MSLRLLISTFVILLATYADPPITSQITDENGIIVETVNTTLGAPDILEYPHVDLFPFASRHSVRYPADRCEPSDANPRLQSFVHNLANGADMRMMMGRWFVALTSTLSYHSRLLYGRVSGGSVGRHLRMCLVYEFNQLSTAHHSTSFDVTMSFMYRGRYHTDYGKMESFEPNNAQLYFTSSSYQLGEKFWIYKVGPEGVDSFGRRQYEYAIVGGCYMRYLQVLTRNPEEFKQKYKEEVLSWLKSQDYDVRGVFQPSYFGCYLDSVAQANGYYVHNRRHDRGYCSRTPDRELITVTERPFSGCGRKHKPYGLAGVSATGDSGSSVGSSIDGPSSATASAEFALALLKAASRCDENFVISPFSLGAALAIVHDGAKEGTQKELAKLLGKDLSPEDVSALYATVIALLRKKRSGVVTRVANGFYVDKEFPFKREFAVHVEKTFFAGVESLNFKNGYKSANLINAFIKSNTGGMIPQLVTADAFADAVAVLINAVYFKGEWGRPFKKDRTKKLSFHGIAGERDIDFMSDSRYVRFSKGDDLAVVELSYKDPAYSLVLLMPTGDFAVWREGLSSETLHAAFESIHTGEIFLQMPKFKVESTTDGKAALEKLGVTSLFTERANLSGISDQTLYVSKIVHKAVIEVTEKGTVAAAAAAFGTVMSMSPVTSLIFDRPFLYTLKYEEAVIFVGQLC